MTETIHIPRTLANQLLHEAQLSPHREVSGLVGRKQQQFHCYPIDNAALDSSVLFALNASEQIDALNHMQSRGEQLFAVYHSHPDAPALPSKIDMAATQYPDALHLIISLNTRGVLEMRGFYLRDAIPQEVELIL